MDVTEEKHARRRVAEYILKQYPWLLDEICDIIEDASKKLWDSIKAGEK